MLQKISLSHRLVDSESELDRKAAMLIALRARNLIKGEPIRVSSSESGVSYRQKSQRSRVTS